VNFLYDCHFHPRARRWPLSLAVSTFSNASSRLLEAPRRSPRVRVTSTRERPLGEWMLRFLSPFLAGIKISLCSPASSKRRTRRPTRSASFRKLCQVAILVVFVDAARHQRFFVKASSTFLFLPLLLSPAEGVWFDCIAAVTHSVSLTYKRK